MNHKRFKFMKFTPFLSLLLLTILSTQLSFAQKTKEPLTFNDARIWRRSAVELSNNGEWYTTQYSLIDKAKKKDTILEQLIDKTSEEFYTNNNKTNVLYIYNAGSGLTYQIPNGIRPTFSDNSEWIAYKIEPDTDDDEKKKDSTFVELKHLTSDFTVRYENSVSYSFPEGKDYLLTKSNNNLLVYDLNNRNEHFIGNVGEYVVDEDSNYIAYTINTSDQHGNGIYLYDFNTETTRTLTSGKATFSNLSWNKNKNSLAALKYNEIEKEIDYEGMSLLVIEDIGSQSSKTVEYLASEIDGLTDEMGLATGSKNKITWSNDDQRLFLEFKNLEKKDDTEKEKEEDQSTVQVWHWKDKKLLSERIMDERWKKEETFSAIFNRNTKTLTPITGEEIQRIITSRGTDNWAIGMDNRSYVSDWDINKNDLYRINLKTGEKVLIEHGYRSSYGNRPNLSPDGTKAIFWDEKDYWCYDFKSNTKKNITENLAVSFVDKEYDKFGYTPSYSFIGWVKGGRSILVSHKLDIWKLSIDGSEEAKNLTSEVTEKEEIRFRLVDGSFLNEKEVEDRYIDLSEPRFLFAFNTKTKLTEFYQLEGDTLSKIKFNGPVSSFSAQSIKKAENSDAVLITMGDDKNYYESYLTDMNFSKPKKLTNTNPQQKKYNWGKRILIDYTNDDGVPLQGVLSIPENYKKGQKLPMVVYTYEKVSQNRYSYASPYLGGTLSQMLCVSNGYLVLYPDIHFNVGTPHSDMHECIDAAIEKVIELGYVDENSIGYNGFSFGGHTGMYVATQDNKFAAISAGAGVSNLVQGFTVDIVRDGSNEQDYYMIHQGRLGTDPTSDTEMYISESAVFNAQNMNTPLLLYHGTEDNVVKWEHSFGYYNLLRYLKKPVILLSYRGEGHGLRQEQNRLDFQKRLMEFFDHYLKGEEAKPWIVEEIPYVPVEEPSNKSLPKWK